MANFHFFSVQRTGGSPTGTDPENRVCDQDFRSQVGQFLLGCTCPVSRGIVVQEQNPLSELPTAFLVQNILQFQQQRLLVLRVDSLAFWKIINEEDAILTPKNRGENISKGILHTDFFGRGERLCRHSIDFCFASGSQ